MDSNGTAINIKDKESINIASKIQTKNNGRILEGYIHCKYLDQEILSESNIDDIEIMWIGFLRITLEYLENGNGESGYSINNQSWAFQKINTKPNNQILLRITKDNEIKKFAVDEHDFLDQIIKGADRFIEFVSKLTYPDSITVLKPLLDQIKNFKPA